MAVYGGDYEDEEEATYAARPPPPPPPRSEEQQEEADFVATNSENKEEGEDEAVGEASPPLAFAVPPQPFPLEANDKTAVAGEANDKELAKTNNMGDEELNHLALSHCLEFASIILKTGAPPNKSWITQFCEDIAKLYQRELHCPVKGLAAIASVPHASPLAQAYGWVYKSQPPARFMYELLLAFKDAQRFDVLHMISIHLSKVFKAQQGRSGELAKLLLFGLRTTPPTGNQDDEDLYEKYSWAKSTGTTPFPWFESTFDFHDMRGTMQRVQLIAQNRAIASPVRLEISGEAFVGNMVTGEERDFALQSTITPNLQFALHWNHELGEIWGTLEQDGSAMRGFLAKQYRPISHYSFGGERMPAKPAQCLVLRDGMCFQTHVVNWGQVKSLSMWVYIHTVPREMVILSSAFLQIAVTAQGQFQVCGQDTEVVACTGKWTFMSINVDEDKVTVFQDDTVVFSLPIAAIPNGEDLLTLGAKDSSGRYALEGGSFCEFKLIDSAVEFPLVCYERGSMQVLASGNGGGLPLIFCNKCDQDFEYLPAPLHCHSWEHEPERIMEPFANLNARGFITKLQFSKQTSTCSLIIHHGTSDNKPVFVCSLLRATEGEDTFSCRIEHNDEEICTLWNVSSGVLLQHNDTLTCELKNGYFTIANVVRISLQLHTTTASAAGGLYFVRADLVGGDLLKFDFSALDGDVPFALPFLPEVVTATPQLGGPKACTICTFSNEPAAVACAMCGSHDFEQQQATLLTSSTSEWKDKWNKFRDDFLQVPRSTPLQHVFKTSASSNELVLQLGAKIVLFQCSALINMTEFPAQALLSEEGTHWQVHIPNAFDYRLDATGKRVLSHSLGWTDSIFVPLQQQVRTSQATLKNMAPGLVNICFQNSILQCLFACKEIRNLVVSLRDPTAAQVSPVFRELNLLFQSMCSTPEAMLLTTALQQVLPLRFREGKQMDAQEFVTFVVDEFERSLHEDKAELNAILAVKTWQERTCKKCNETRQDSTPLLSHTGLVLNLPRQFYPITHLRLVTCQSAGEWLPACEENEVRLMENLNSHGGFCYLYVKREPELKPITGIAAKPLPNGEELNMGSVKLYFTRDDQFGLPITDLTLLEGSSAQAGIPCGRRYKLAHHSTMPITDICVGTATELTKRGGVNRVARALGENSKGEAMYLAYSCAFNKPPLTQLDASNNEQDDEDNEAVVCAEIDGQQWRFAQSWGVGSPIIRLEVVSSEETQGELVSLARGDNPIWKVEVASPQFSSRLFSQTLLGDCHLHTQIAGSIGEYRFEDGVVVIENDNEVTVMCRLRADGSLHARWDTAQSKWTTIGDNDAFEKKYIYQLEQRKTSEMSGNKFVRLCPLQNGDYLMGRLYKLRKDEKPLNGIQIQTLVGEEQVELDSGYKEAFCFPEESGLVVRLCTTSTAVGALPLRDIYFAAPQPIRRSSSTQLDKGQVTPTLHLFVEHEREDEQAWEGVFYNKEGKKLALFPNNAAQTAGKRIEFTFGGKTNLFQGVCLPDKRAWGFMRHQTAAAKPLFVRVEWEHAAKLVLKSYYSDLACTLLLDSTKIRIHRDSREYWQENTCLFSTRVRNNNVSTLCAMELADTCVLAGENMVACESGKQNCHGGKQPHISRKRVELPSTLVVHLNRMRFEPTRGTVKDQTIIPLGTSEVLRLQDEDYALLAVVSHTGSSAESGHYRAYCRYSVNDQAWLLLDDSKPVSKTTFANMTRAFECQQKSEETPYLLFYGRKNKEEPAEVAVPRKQELMDSFLRRYSASQPILEARRFNLGL